MVALNSDFAESKPDTDTKNRVGRFFSLAAENAGADRRPSRKCNGEKRYCRYDLASVDTEFEYGPFGELIRATGEEKDVFNFRFSTKYEDTETGLLYYGYRYYNAETGRWLNRDPIEEQGGLNIYGILDNDPVNYVDFLGYWKIYDVMGGRANLRFELSISALTRKFNLPRIPIVHDTLKSYGIVLESKQLEKNGQDCVEVSIGGFGNAGALKNALKSGLRRVPGVRKVADKIDADVVLIGSIKVIDCECFKREDVNLGGEFKIQAQAGYGGFFGRKPGRTRDYRSGSGGAVDRFGLGGIRGPFVGAFAEFGFSPSLSNEGLDLEIGGGATGFVGYRGAIIDVRAGGELSGKVVFGIIPELKYKEGGFNASFF